MTRFLLNGTPRTAPDMDAGRTVLEHLRLHERLTATKEGCAEGDCGACTVAIGRPDGDGNLRFKAVNACIMRAADLDGCAVVTAEGVALDGALGPVQQALVECHASQCGFCTPGFVMSLYAYAQRTPMADPAARRDVVLDALSGNLCRCTGYRPIIDAAMSLNHEPEPRRQGWCAALAAVGTEIDEAAPRNMEHLDYLLAKNPAAKLVGGCTDIGVGIAKHGNVPAGLISLRQVAGLDEIYETEDALVIGAGATYSAILPYLESHFPAFANLVRRIGSVQIRNLGTMGGNICNASPIGDSAPCLLALEAALNIRSAGGRRRLPIDEFFLGYRKTALLPGEYLESIHVPLRPCSENFHAYKIAKRFDEDISTLAAAFCVMTDKGRVTYIRAAFGGMAATPARAPALEAALLGTTVTAAHFAAAGAAIDVDFIPLSDFRASASYRAAAAKNLITRLGAQLMAPAGVSDIWAL